MALNSKDRKKISNTDAFKTLTKEEQEAVLSMDSVTEFKKGDILLREGQYCQYCFFVVEGLVREFRIVDGEDVTAEFYSDTESIFSSTSALNSKPSSFSLECLEDSRINRVSFEQEREMYARFPRFEKMCRLQTEQNLLAFQEKFATYMSSSPEERYLQMLKTRPDIMNRVPQYHLASYLGVKPESLSRIRKRISVKT